MLELRRNTFEVRPVYASSREEVVEALEIEPIELVLTDHAMPNLSSLDVIELARERCPCIVVSGAVGEETAVGLLRQGAVDYVNKDNLPRLGPAVRRALAEAQNRKARREAEEALRRAHAELERRVEERTAALQHSYRRLRQEMEERHRAENELRQARLKLTRLREDERLHLSREIHDGVVQDLLGICFGLADTEREAGALSLKVKAQVKQHREELLETVRRLRNLIKGLRPPGLEEFGLNQALEEFIASTSEQPGAPEIRLEVQPSDVQLSPAVAQCFFRIVQEALRNILRHAQARTVRIRVEQSDSEARLLITDDGKGFKKPGRLSALARDDHFGLVLMEEHAQLVGGAFRLESEPDQGTQVLVTVPSEPPAVS